MLEELFQELNHIHFAGVLPLPKLSWNSRLRSTAGRFCPGSRNPLKPRMPEIEIASYLSSISDGPLHIRDTMLHEMIHFLLWFQRKPYGHTGEFLEIMQRVGAKRYNPVPKQAPYKHLYECPHCLVQWPTRRKLGPVACGPCCKKHNAGDFAEKFRLRKIDVMHLGKTIAPKEDEFFTSPADTINKLEELKKLILRGRGISA